MTPKPHDMKTRLLPLSLATLVCLLSQCTVPAGGEGGGDSSLLSATKEQPFVNSLGMKFVPVPGTKILMCTTETTVAQYQAAGLGYQSPDFPQGADHCAVNISHDDAKVWLRWLSKKEGRKYRLPTNKEWSAAVGTSTYPWGNQWPPPHNAGNYMGQEHKSGSTSLSYFKPRVAGSTKGVIGGYRDNHIFTAPVGSYSPNRLGIYDLGGNAWEWMGDGVVVRGGDWNFAGEKFFCTTTLSAEFYTPNYRASNHGFRCVLQL